MIMEFIQSFGAGIAIGLLAGIIIFIFKNRS